MFAVQRLLKRQKENPKTGGKKIVNHVSNKGIVSKIQFLKFLQFKSKKMVNPREKWGKDMNNHFIEEEI